MLSARYHFLHSLYSGKVINYVKSGIVLVYIFFGKIVKSLEQRHFFWKKFEILIKVMINRIFENFKNFNSENQY